MTYDASEASRDAGAPVELYRFAMGGLAWYYTSSDQAVTFNGHLYVPETIVRDELEYGSDQAVSALSVRIPRENPVAQLFVAGMPAQPVTVTVYRFHRDDPADVVGLPPAEVADWDYDDPSGLAKLACHTVAQLLERRVPAVGVRRQCSHVLYGEQGCRASRAAHTVAAVVASVSGLDVVLTMSPEPADGTYAYGYLETQAGRRLHVARQVGTTFTLLTPPPAEVVAGLAVQAVEGCDRTLATCHARFGNAPRFLGWPELPTSNPFTEGV
jgi:uncharacterized phage protein (TIGR02218 family)